MAKQRKLPKAKDQQRLSRLRGHFKFGLPENQYGANPEGNREERRRAKKAGRKKGK